MDINAGFVWSFVCSVMYVSVCANSFEINQAVLDAGLIISQAGEWKLTESVVLHGLHDIKVQVDDVVIDLHGYTIQAGEDASRGITVQRHNCIIKNGVLSGFTGEALYICDASAVRIEHLSIDNSLHGVQIVNSSDVELEQVEIKVVSNGLSVTESQYVSVQNCVLEDIECIGILIQGKSEGILLEMIRIESCDSTGILINSDDLQLIRIWVQHGSGDGVIVNGNGVFCESVASAYNAGSGFILGGANSVLRTCAAHNNEGDGVTLTSNAQNNSLILGIYASNGLIGINNNGASTNKVLYAKVYENMQRNMYHISNSLAGQ